MKMFTGIVQGLANVHSIEKGEAVWTFAIDLPNTAGLERGASVAVNGVCLTATDMAGGVTLNGLSPGVHTCSDASGAARTLLIISP